MFSQNLSIPDRRNVARFSENNRNEKHTERVNAESESHKRGGPILSLTDAVERMRKSRVLARIRENLIAHRSSHRKFFWECQLDPCSQIGLHLRCYAEAAQEELDAILNLEKASAEARRACPGASEEQIEALAKTVIKASAPADNTNHPLMRLESPYDPSRIYNSKYPGLEFHRGAYMNANPAISAAYYSKFLEGFSEDLLFNFMDTHPVEFQCSGWVLSVLGGKLLGWPRPGTNGEKKAYKLFRKYWKRIEHPEINALSLPKIFVLAIASQEESEIAGGKHRKHFERAVRWIARSSDSRETLGPFMHDLGRACSCYSLIEFSELKKAVRYIQRVEDLDIPFTAHVLQEYVGRVCGVPSRTLRSWRKPFNLARS